MPQLTLPHFNPFAEGFGAADGPCDTLRQPVSRDTLTPSQRASGLLTAPATACDSPCPEISVGKDTGNIISFYVDFGSRVFHL